MRSRLFVGALAALVAFSVTNLMGNHTASAEAVPVQKKSVKALVAKSLAARQAPLVSRSMVRTKADSKVYTFDKVLQYKWSSEQFVCVEKLWTKESNWNPKSHNKSSGAHGIPQALPASKMASAGKDYMTSPATQIDWGLHYIKSRYGSPCRAWKHSERYGWY